jgi:Domain of unknown function (DUF4833)
MAMTSWSMVRLAVLLVFAGPLISRADDVYLPLFVIERSTNANVVYYDARVTKSGKLNAEEPVVAYWIMLAGNGRREELNPIEKESNSKSPKRNRPLPPPFIPESSACSSLHPQVR